MSAGKGIGFGAGLVLGGCGALVLLVAGGWWLMSAAKAKVATLEAQQIEKAIQEHRAEMNMTEAQVRQALGEPKLIDLSPADHQRWLYPGHKPIIMKDGKVWLVER